MHKADDPKTKHSADAAGASSSDAAGAPPAMFNAHADRTSAPVADDTERASLPAAHHASAHQPYSTRRSSSPDAHDASRAVDRAADRPSRSSQHGGRRASLSRSGEERLETPVRAAARVPDSALRTFFRKFAHKTSTSMGSPWAFVLAFLVILVWGITGPIFHFSDTWQLVINTGTTIVTFLMVFLIQNTQNRDAIALHIKIDELIRAVKGARNQLIDIEELSDEEIEALHAEFRKLGTGTPASHPYPEKKER